MDLFQDPVKKLLHGSFPRPSEKAVAGSYMDLFQDPVKTWIFSKTHWTIWIFPMVPCHFWKPWTIANTTTYGWHHAHAKGHLRKSLLQDLQGSFPRTFGSFFQNLTSFCWWWKLPWHPSALAPWPHPWQLWSPWPLPSKSPSACQP